MARGSTPVKRVQGASSPEGVSCVASSQAWQPRSKMAVDFATLSTEQRQRLLGVAQRLADAGLRDADIARYFQLLQTGPTEEADLEDAEPMARLEAEIEFLGEALPANWRSWLTDSQIFYVSPDMARLVVHAARTIPEEPLAADDPPALDGFCVFDPFPAIESFYIPPKPGPPRAARAVQWHFMEGSRGPGFAALTYYQVKDGDRELLRVGFPKFHACAVAPSGPEGESSVLEDLLLSGRGLKSMWTIMGQKLARLSDEPVDRATRRQLERSRSAVKLNPVRVVMLRREQTYRMDGEKPRPGAVERFHRWMVSGHWRNQWLPRTKSHRHQWIAPYVKGPEDKPLILRRAVRELVR